jgi:hypothetical protein
MSGTLTFAANSEERDSIAASSGALNFKNMSQFDEVHKALIGGQDVVTLMSDMNVGYTLPEGCKVAFTEDCPEYGPVREQAEARAYRSGGSKLRPYQIAVIDALKDMPEEEFMERMKTLGSRRVGKTAAALGEHLHPTRALLQNDTGSIETLRKVLGDGPSLDGFSQFADRTLRGNPGEVVIKTLPPIEDIEDRLAKKMDIVMDVEVHHIKDPFKNAGPVKSAENIEEPTMP